MTRRTKTVDMVLFVIPAHAGDNREVGQNVGG